MQTFGRPQGGGPFAMVRVADDEQTCNYSMQPPTIVLEQGAVAIAKIVAGAPCAFTPLQITLSDDIATVTSMEPYTFSAHGDRAGTADVFLHTGQRTFQVGTLTVVSPGRRRSVRR